MTHGAESLFLWYFPAAYLLWWDDRSFDHFLTRLFVFLLSSLESSSYISDNCPLSYMSFANFSLSPWLVFSFSNSVFCSAEVFNFNWLKCIHFFPWIIPLAWWLKHHCPKHQAHLDFLLCFSSKTCILSHFTFGYMIHFKFSFVKGVRSLSRLVFPGGCPVASVPFVEKGSPSPFLSYGLCSFAKDDLALFVWVCVGALFCSTEVSVQSLASPTLSWSL